jgi:hypothetical protein
VDEVTPLEQQGLAGFLGERVREAVAAEIRRSAASSIACAMTLASGSSRRIAISAEVSTIIAGRPCSS